MKVILFDLDGTIIDTERAAVDAVNLCFQLWKLTVSAEDAAFVTGRTWDVAIELLLDKYPIPISKDEFRNLVVKKYRELLEEELLTVPGSVEAITRLAPHYPLGLVSGSDRNQILWALKKLKIDHHFSVILGSEDYAQSKPAPHGYRKALELLQASPEEAIVFEDSTAGITSARNAGTWVVAVSSTNHFNQELTEAHEKIEDLTAITKQWIEEFSRRVTNPKKSRSSK